jgi:glucose/arabinose dehydrogenase
MTYRAAFSMQRRFGIPPSVALVALLTLGLSVTTLTTSGTTAQAQTKLAVTVAPGYELETIASDLKAPRGVLAVSDSEAWVVEFGGWNPKTGSLVKLTKTGKTWSVKRVLTKLDRPLSIVKGPDGKLYVGEVGKISRFDPAVSPIAMEAVVTGLPGKGLHPLTPFAFTPEKQLLVGVGSSTNNCEKFKGKPTCPAAEGRNAIAVIRKYTMDWPSGKAGAWTVAARGLRNSMGMAVHSSGTVMQAENGRDDITKADPKLSDDTLPNDELNVVVQGGNYGWPYCYSDQRPSPEFKTYACKQTVAPLKLLPAHAAPLGMTYWGNQLVVSYHGYRDTGHRLMGFPIDSSGKPNGEGVELIGNWGETDTQEFGGPVGTAVAPDDSLWVTDDRNNVIVRLSKR